MGRGLTKPINEKKNVSAGTTNNFNGLVQADIKKRKKNHRPVSTTEDFRRRQ